MSKKYLEGTRIEDLRGIKFGRLTVIELDMNRSTIKTKYWICRCECGRNISASRCTLFDEHDSSCGICKLYTFEQWCLDNSHKEYLDLWDYELNDKKPSEIAYCSNKKYFFKCSSGLHKSELWTIHTITQSSQLGTISLCRKCGSIGQYLIDTYGNTDVWSDNNNKDPFTIFKGSRKVYLFKCCDCGYEKRMPVTKFINGGINCSRCGDGQSYPNKFITSILSQINTNFRTEVVFEWSHGKRYDFYIGDVNSIIEVNGIQHYKYSGFSRSLEEEQENDALKMDLAKENKIINYIILDCRKSELEWIKNSVMESELPKLLNFKEEDIDWLQCHKYASSNIVFKFCKLWNTGNFNNAMELGNYFGLCKVTARKYLKIGNELGWCEYTGSEHYKDTRKRIRVFSIDGKDCGIFESIAMLEEVSESTFGVKFDRSCISRVCHEKLNHHRGFVFEIV